MLYGYIVFFLNTREQKNYKGQHSILFSIPMLISNRQVTFSYVLFCLGTMEMPHISLYLLFLTCDVYITDCLHSKYVNYSFEENSFSVSDVIK